MRLKNPASLCAYASDASIYAIRPSEIIPVEFQNDVIEAILMAAKAGTSITARGAGTGLAGGALGDGIILDFGNYRKIRSIEPQLLSVHTEVGLIYDELNAALKDYNLFFPPDPSSGDSCQIGGMLANNSSGPRSVKYGLTSDFVEELEIVDSRGRLLPLKKLRLNSPELAEFLGRFPEYKAILNILQENAALINSSWPKLKKNSAGYNLYQVVRDLERGIFNLPALMAGSEGTLGIILTARLRLLPLPKELLTIRIYFKSLVAAGRAVEKILILEPSGLEIVDGSTLNLIGRQKHGIPEEAAALLLVEFDNDISLKRRDFEKLAANLDLAGVPEYADDPAQAAPLWKARKAIVPTLYRHHATRRPVALVEDVSLPPGEVPSFIEYITALFDRHNLTYGVFGHIGDGNLHLRPLFDLNDPADFRLAGEIYDQVYDKVIALGGGTTAEHADGRLRASLLKKMYGDRIYDIFVAIKKTLDPGGVFSPGSVISSEPFTAHIDYEKIKSYCAACGKCNGYCPAYDLFRREDMSARGWLRMINQSEAPREVLQDYLAWCLNCKNCTTVCPAGVDIAHEIIEYKSRQSGWMARQGASLADNEFLLGLSLKFGKILDPLTQSRATRKILGIVGKPFGLDENFPLPKIAGRSLRQRFSHRLAPTGEVAFFHGCADNLLQSNVGEAVFEVFEYYRIPLSIPEQKCCGLPYEVHGLKDSLLEKASFNIEHLNRFEAVITGCASCLLRLKEYAGLFKGTSTEKPAAILAAKCYDISQYLNLKGIDLSGLAGDKPVKITYHNPCHLRAAGLHREPEKLLGKLPGVEIIHPLYADRCCAQAGAYGFAHYPQSRQMFAAKKTVYEKINADYLMTSCPACQMKVRAEIKGNTRVVHPVEIIAERIKSAPGFRPGKE